MLPQDTRRGWIEPKKRLPSATCVSRAQAPHTYLRKRQVVLPKGLLYHHHLRKEHRISLCYNAELTASLALYRTVCCRGITRLAASEHLNSLSAAAGNFTQNATHLPLSAPESWIHPRTRRQHLVDCEHQLSPFKRNVINTTVGAYKLYVMLTKMNVRIFQCGTNAIRDGLRNLLLNETGSEGPERLVQQVVSALLPIT